MHGLNIVDGNVAKWNKHLLEALIVFKVIKGNTVQTASAMSLRNTPGL